VALLAVTGRPFACVTTIKKWVWLDQHTSLDQSQKGSKWQQQPAAGTKGFYITHRHDQMVFGMNDRYKDSTKVHQTKKLNSDPIGPSMAIQSQQTNKMKQF
jgi:hypothetical protein